MRFSEIFAQEFKKNFYVDVDTFPFKIIVDNNYKIEKIVMETEFQNVSCIYITGQNYISCSYKGIWFTITPSVNLKNVIKKEPAALKKIFQNNPNIIYWELSEKDIQIFKERNSFLF